MDNQLPKWAARHALFAPWGIVATTCVLVALTGSVGWKVWNNLTTISDMVDLGVVVYAAGASLVEVSIKMAFYAIEQRQKERERIRKEARQEGLHEGKQQGRREGRHEGKQQGRKEAVRMFAHNIILKSSQNPEASVEDLVEAVASEMEDAEKG